MHPLLNDITKLTTEELNEKFLELTKKISAAYKLGYGDAVYQLQIILESYRAEIKHRNDKMLEEALSKSKEFKNIIDIN